MPQHNAFAERGMRELDEQAGLERAVRDAGILLATMAVADALCRMNSRPGVRSRAAQPTTSTRSAACTTLARSERSVLRSSTRCVTHRERVRDDGPAASAPRCLGATRMDQNH